MPFLRLLWRLARRRWARRVVLWFVFRVLRLLGWRRLLKLVLRQLRRARMFRSARAVIARPATD